MCTTMLASFGETTCTRADPGPDVTRCTAQRAGTITPTRPSTNSVIGTPATDGRTSCPAANPPQTTAADSTALANTAVARPPRLVDGRATGARTSSSDGSASTLRRTQSRSQIVTTTPLARRRSAISAPSRPAPSTPSGPSTTTAVDAGIFVTTPSTFPCATTWMSPPGNDTTTNSGAISTTANGRSDSPSRNACARRGTAHPVHARRRPPRRTNERDRIGRAAYDIVHNGSPHVRDGYRTLVDQGQLVVNAVDTGRNPLRVRMVGASDCCRADLYDDAGHGGAVQATW